MDDQRENFETKKAIDRKDDNLETIKSSTNMGMADDQAVVEKIVIIPDTAEKTEGSFDHEKVAGVLDDNVIEGKELKDEKSSSCVIDVKLGDDDDVGGSGSGSGSGTDIGGGGELVCRICHLSSDQSPGGLGGRSSGGGGSMKEMNLVQLGCGCKDELGVAHSHCAEIWFKLKGNRICEICGEAARNVTGIIQEPRFMEEWNQRRSRSYGSSVSYGPERSGGWWRAQPCCNFLMACLIVAFVLPWFFRVDIF